MSKIIVAALEISNALFVIDVSDVINGELFTWNLSEVMQNTEEKVGKNNFIQNNYMMLLLSKTTNKWS